MSEKYLAGFLDADGHLSIRTRKGATPDMEVSVAQRPDFAAPLVELRDMFGGVIREKYSGEYLELQMRCGPAVKCAERLKKYMVLKQHHAEQYLDMVFHAPVLRTDSEVLEFRKKVKAVRREPCKTKRNFPPRKWMAGYIDGDGSFAVKKCKKTGYAYPFLTILAAENYTPGIELIQKAFGGAIRISGTNSILQLQLSNPSKAKQIIRYCGKYLQKKYDVARFILECAKNGNFRDGEAIRSTVSALNSQQHRLSDSTGTVDRLIDNIKFDIPKKSLGRPVGVKEAHPRRKRQSNL